MIHAQRGQVDVILGVTDVDQASLAASPLGGAVALDGTVGDVFEIDLVGRLSLKCRIVQVGAPCSVGLGVRYAFEVYQVSATAESVTASGS